MTCPMMRTPSQRGAVDIAKRMKREPVRQQPAATLADLCWASVRGLAVLRADRHLGPHDPIHPGDTPLPDRVLDALAPVLRR